MSPEVYGTCTAISPIHTGENLLFLTQFQQLQTSKSEEFRAFLRSQKIPIQPLTEKKRADFSIEKRIGGV
jgi:hypothetical protein